MLSKSFLVITIAALASSAAAGPLLRRNAQGSYSNITMGTNTLNWGSGSPSDVVSQALGAQCTSGGTQCDQTTWTQEQTVCSDNSDGTTCQQEDINVVCDGQWPDDNMRQALVAGLSTAIGTEVGTATVTIAGTGGGPYSAYYPGTTFTAYTGSSFVGMTVYADSDDGGEPTLIGQMSATITVTMIDDNWCGEAATDAFGAGGAIASAVGQDELSAAFGLLSAACDS